MFTNKLHPTQHLTINGQQERVFDGPVHDTWSAVAQTKGFSITARVADRYHLALRCDVCGELSKTKLFVLMNNQPICAPCLHTRQAATAEAAGMTMLHRDPANRHYAFYGSPCGHTVRRQFEMVGRIAAGEVNLRCEVCLLAKHAAEAAAQGWTLLGADPGGRVAYRLYRHDTCGAEQPVALGNMHTGRFDCAGCGESWVTAPSTIYVMGFRLSDGEPVVKLGFARKPGSRLNHQLQAGLKRTGAVLRVVNMPSGRAALREEQGMHRRVKAKLPQTLVPVARFESEIKVKSEIYTPDALPLITALLDDLEARLAA